MLNARREKLLSALGNGFEAALIQSNANKFYLLDFDAGNAGTLLLLKNRMVFIIDARYIENAKDNIKDAEVVLEENKTKQLSKILKDEGIQNLQLETEISVAKFEMIKKNLQGVKVSASANLSEKIEKLRQIKDENEISRIRQAQEITDNCFLHILPFVKQGVSETQLMLEMEYYMRSHGAQKLAFDTICVAGVNTSLPHGEPSNYCLQNGDFITFDFGAKVCGYCTDMTRTVALGKPHAKKLHVYETVHKAQLAGLCAVQAGKTGSEIDKAARDIINAAGYEGCFGHGLGHAVGIEIHESPRFSPKCNDVILENMVMTVEPGCYIEKQFGCRIEDTVLVTKQGCEPLAKSEKNLIVL